MKAKNVKKFGDILVGCGMLLLSIPVILAILLAGPTIIYFTIISQTFSMLSKIALVFLGLVGCLCATGGMIGFFADSWINAEPKTFKKGTFKKGRPKP